MLLLKLADEVYELQGWAPPAKKPETVATKNRSVREMPVSSNKPRDKSSD